MARLHDTEVVLEERVRVPSGLRYELVGLSVLYCELSSWRWPCKLPCRGPPPVPQTALPSCVARGGDKEHPSQSGRGAFPVLAAAGREEGQGAEEGEARKASATGGQDPAGLRAGFPSGLRGAAGTRAQETTPVTERGPVALPDHPRGIDGDAQLRQEHRQRVRDLLCIVGDGADRPTNTFVPLARRAPLKRDASSASENASQG